MGCGSNERKERASSDPGRGPQEAAPAYGSGFTTTYGRIISLSSWSMMWQCQT